GGHGRPPFPATAGCRVGKSARMFPWRACDVAGKALSFGDFSLGQQRKVTRSPAAGGSSCPFCSFTSHGKAVSKSEASVRLRRPGSFLLLAQKKRTKEKGLPRRS